MNAGRRDVQIEAPELLTPRQRSRDTLVTAVMWGIYLYLWVPVVSLFAWLLGFEFAYDVMIRAGGAAELGTILKFYGIVVLVILVTVTAWSLGNRIRYGRRERRHAANALPAAQLARYFGLAKSEVERLQSMRSVRIDFDAEGRPLIEAPPAPRRQAP